MKKLLSLLLITAMVLSFAPAVMAADGIPVYLNGEKIEKDGIIVNDRTFLPVRALAEALGYTVDWVNDTRSVIIGTAPEETVKTDKVNIYLEGVKMENAEAIIVNDSTFLPVRALCEALDKDVEWNNEKREVYVTDKKMDEDPFSGKYFRLKHKSTGRYLCVESAKTADGAKAIQSDAKGEVIVTEYAETKVDEVLEKNNNSDSNNPTADGYYYRTPSGSKYHLDPNCGGKNSYRTENISDLSPCSKCAK